MSRQTFQDWFVACQRRVAHGGNNSRAASPHRRRLRLEPLEDRRLLAVVTVDTLIDENDGIDVGGISLRDAIAAAMPSDSIDFAVMGTITLEHGELVVNKELSIVGPGADVLSIDADSANRVFNIDDGTGALATVSISGLTITGGYIAGDGGGVSNAENLTIVASTISGNTSIHSGGGVFTHQGSLTIRDSTLSGNTAQYGGGLYVVSGLDFTTTLTNSTVSGNTATDGGGGIYNFLGRLLIEQSTITDNEADPGRGAGVVSWGDQDTTLTEVYSSIVSGNRSNQQVAGYDVDVVGGPVMGPENTVVSLGYNLVGSGSAVGEFTAPGDLPPGMDPLLGPLNDNGGPTKTHALLYGSIAIDSGDDTFTPPPDHDQRGEPFARVFGGRMDIGAFEAEASYFRVDTLMDEDDGIGVGAGTSLRDALAAANFIDVDAAVITFDPALTEIGPRSILLTYGQLNVDANVTIAGPGANRLTIDAQGASRVILVDDFDGGSLSEVTIRGLTLTGGVHAGQDEGGGGIFNNERLTLRASILTGNEARWGGGIYNFTDGELTVERSTLSGNSAMFGGAGVYNWGGDVDILETTVSGNDAADAAGVLNANSGEMLIEASTISGNHATGGNGGGILQAGGLLTIRNSTISGNEADNEGGGIQHAFGPLEIYHSTITANRADADQSGIGFGGGIFHVLGPTLLVDHTIVAGNFRHASARDDVAGSFDARFSLFGDATGSSINDLEGSLIGDDESPIDPLLGDLEDNSGPTLTHALLTDSPAIDTGDPDFNPPPDYDQRGVRFDRESGVQIDIGAFEVQSAVVLPALPGDYNLDEAVDAADYTVWRDTLGQDVAAFYDGADGDGDGTIDEDDYDVWKANFGNSISMLGYAALAGGGAGGGPILVTTLVDGINFNDGHTSLREAVFAANTVVGPDTIEFDPALTAGGPATILLTMGELAITGELSIVGPGSTLLSIDASGSDLTPDLDDGAGSRIFNINDGDDDVAIDVNITSLTLTGGDVGLDGGAVLSYENLTITSSDLTGNVALDDGGAIYGYRGNLTLINSAVSGNKVFGPNGDGGGINCNFTETGSLTITGCTIAQNISNRRGGAISAFRTAVTISNSFIGQNSVTGTNGTGGAIFAADGNTSLDTCEIADNIASGTASRGGGIFHVGNLEIVDSVISGNHADGDTSGGGGVFSSYGLTSVLRSTINDNTAHGGGGGLYLWMSDLALTDSTVRSNLSAGMPAFGGGIFGNGDMTIVRSTISENEAAYGGGIHIVVGNLLVEDSTIYNNSAGESGGGIFRGVSGETPAVARIVNSTISDNFAQVLGGGIVNYARTEIEFSTITNNTALADMGSGIAGDSEASTVHVRSSIIAGNENTDVDFVGFAPTNIFESAGYNLIGDGNAVAAFDESGDLIGVVDPMLAPITDNGGPTWTHSILAGSPAIDAGDPTAVVGTDGVPMNDQRGAPFGRIRDGNGNEAARIDVGAYERFVTTYFVDTVADENDGDYSEGDLSLREAIELSAPSPEIDTIEFSPSLTAGGSATIVLTLGELLLARSVVINGPGAELLTIDASGNDLNPDVFGDGSRIFNVDNNNSAISIGVEIRGLTLTGGDSSQGGAILSRESLFCESIVVTGNQATAGGAIALLNFGGGTTIADSTIVQNKASSQGGAFLIQANAIGTATIRDNTISGNTANRGGALYVASGSTGSTLIITGNSIADNAALQQGGAIYFATSNVLKTTIRSSTLSGNTAGQQGGGLFITGGRDLAIVDSSIVNNKSLATNSSQGRGGGIYNNMGDVAITGSTISGNVAWFGGGIYSRNGELAVNFCTLQSNQATDGNGGGIFSQNDRLTLIGSTISGNAAISATTNNGRGGGLFHAPSFNAPSTILENRVLGNSATNYGGGVYFRAVSETASSGSLSLTNMTISGNTAKRGGGVASGAGTVGASAGTLVFNDGSISGNTAALNGGGVYSRSGILNFNGTTIAGNRAGNHGGGIAAPQTGSQSTQMYFVGATISGNLAGVDGVGGEGVGDGGGLWISSGTLAVSFIQSQISENAARRGGGIFRGTQSASATLATIGSTISGNLAEDKGGGIYCQGGFLSLTSTAITGNTAAGAIVGHGGGIFSRSTDVSLVNSSLTGNSALDARGGGLYLGQSGDLTVIGSTIAANFAKLDGGGIAAMTTTRYANFIQSSTISGNSSLGTGGLFVRGNTTIRHSTITANSGGFNGAGGLLAGDGNQLLEFDHTIVAGNKAAEGGSPDFRFFVGAFGMTMRSSLIGDNSGTLLVEAPVGSPDVNGNLIGKPVGSGGSGVIDPLLGPLANNGGPTRTHALLPGSPALDAGSLITGPPQGYDQRGNPFSRMVDGTGDGVVRIDVGAYESQGVPSFSPGDYGRNGVVDAADYTVWRNSAGALVTPFELADGDGDGMVDADDYAIWKAHFGAGLVFTLGGGGSSAIAAPEPLGRMLSPAALEFASQPPALPGVRTSATNLLARSIPASAARENDALVAWLAAQPRRTTANDDAFTQDADESAASDADSDPIEVAIDTAFAALGV